MSKEKQIEKKNCKECLHFEACSKWTDFPKQIGFPVCRKYRKQSEGERNYKALYEQLLEDFEHALHYAGKNNNVCNFCEHDCGEGGVCKGRDSFIYCTPKWRGVKKIIPDCEAPKGGE